MHFVPMTNTYHVFLRLVPISISKQSKRASLLFNDMLSALSAPGSISTTPSPASSSPQAKHLATNCPSTPISPLVLDPVVGTFINPGTYSSLSSSSASLLEDSEEGPEDESGGVLQPDDRGLPVAKANMVPDSDNTTINGKTPEAMAKKVKAKGVGVTGTPVDDNDDDSDDDDDQEKWNW